MTNLLYQLGSLAFEVAPVNVHAVKEEFGGDYAAKDVVGAARPREFVGEGDSHFVLHGRLFPQKFGGLDQIDVLKEMSTSGEPQVLVRGDGTVLGFYLIDKVETDGQYLDGNGVPRLLEYSIQLVKSPDGPSAGSALTTLFRLLSL